MAFAAKHDNRTHKVIVLLGDGECEEGSVWEMALFASHHGLSNLVIVVDHNKYQAMDKCENILGLTDLASKWAAFGFNVIEVNGHNHSEIKLGFNKLSEKRPNCIIANTIKGKGVSFMENNILWHYRDPQGEFFSKAIEDLEVLDK